MKKSIVWLLSAVILVLLVVLGTMIWYVYYLNSHVIVDDMAFEKSVESIDLRGTGASVEEYEQLRSQFPDIPIRYDLPFQGTFYEDDTREITISALTEADIALLDYLPKLEMVHAEGCSDYGLLLQLQARRPECHVSYSVPLMGESYGEETEELQFGENQPQLQELLDALCWLPNVKQIHFEQPRLSLEELLRLRETYPGIAVTWVKDALGETYADDVTEIDLSGREDLTFDQIERELAYFPDLEKVVMCNCGFDDETMAAFREKMRSRFKVVWSLEIYGIEVRTDDPYFMPAKHHVEVSNYQVQKLRYCEDMLCVDLGHMPITDLSFLEGMTHLKYFICIDSPLMYIEPISNCKELIYVELFWTQISDFTPLLGCTSLQDLNISRTNGDPMVFKDMPWLKNLWIDGYDISRASERQELEAALPNTYIKYCDGEMTANGWRDLQNYFDMRDLLGMPYNTW